MVGAGRVPIVLVAPHGGRRHRPIRRGDGINDLGTAEIADELAARCGAFALINRRVDRNDIDFNRISDLTELAPEFLEQLQSLIEAAAALGQGAPLVLFVHGWNVAMACCDVGVGVRERGGELLGANPTLSRDAFDGFVRGLAQVLARTGIATTIGHRYPGSGRDNAVQLFSGRHQSHPHHRVAAISALAAAGGVDAVQLELGILLRWPGPNREQLLCGLVATIDAEVKRRGALQKVAARSGDWIVPAQSRPAGVAAPEAGYSLQAALGDGTGVFLGVEPTGSAGMAARVCVALPRGPMFLFVGEGPWSGRDGDYSLSGLNWQVDRGYGADAEHEVRVDFEGLLVGYPDHRAFVDLERGLAASELVQARIALVYKGGSEGFGRLCGSIELAAENRELDVAAVASRGSRRQANAKPGGRVYLTSGLGSPRVVETGGEGVWFTHGDDAEIYSVTLSGDDGRAITGDVCVCVTVYRVTGDACVDRSTFGVARFTQPGSPSSESCVFELVENI